ncbi:MAG: cytochrome d ubiquinol oxidase subunit II [Ignavibacteriales bacterium]|nr:MAG: cytochrome d ubiquinol oxidase subunit II [Ignavibacteriales bacterium]
MDLNIIWFLLFMVLIIGYAVLDGFDLGVGVLHLFTKDENEKRINLNAIGPIWDGNEVWLLTGGGALFAAFPIVYATIFSGFYLAFMLLLTALIFRAVSFEFRKYTETPKNKKYWDFTFAIGSLLPALLYGVAVGNILRGLPVEIVDGKISASISFLGLLNPYSILIGLISLVLFTMHGAIYMTMKCDGLQRDKMISWINKTWIVLITLYLVATIASFFEASYLFTGILKNPIFWILFILLFASIVYIPIAVKATRFGRAFLASSVTITTMIGLAALSLFPRLVPSSINLANSLTIYNASSSEKTLFTMLIIALIGVPIVVIYTIVIYRIFRGKVVITPDSY